MLRTILRNVQYTLLLSASLLVLLAFQRLQNDELFSIGQFQHNDPHLDRHDITRTGGWHSKIFSTNVIEIGLFRFVVPFRWENSAREGEAITAAGPKPPTVTRKAKRKPEGAIMRPNPNNMVSTENRITNKITDGKLGENDLAKKYSVAYLVPISSCLSEDLELTEGLAVLQQSIIVAHNTSEYKFKLFAVARHDAEGCAVVATAKSLGMELIIIQDDAETPIEAVDTDSNQRVTMGQDGKGSYVSGAQDREHSCTQTTPLSPVLLSHDIIVLLGTDSLVMRPLDSLFDAILYPEESLHWLKTSQLLSRLDKNARTSYKVDAFVAQGMDFAIMKRGCKDTFRVLSEMLNRCTQQNHSNNATTTSSVSQSRLAHLSSRQQQQQLQNSDLGSETDRYSSNLFWLDPCLFGRCEKHSGCSCDFGAPFGDSWVSFSGSCSPPWGCNGNNYGNGVDGVYCEELHRAWFYYRRQLDLRILQDQPLVKHGVVTDYHSSYGTYCKHGGVEGYIRYRPQNQVRSTVARFLTSIGWR